MPLSGTGGRVLVSAPKGASALDAPGLNASPATRDSESRSELTSKSRLPAFVCCPRGNGAQLASCVMSPDPGDSLPGGGPSGANADVHLSPDAGIQAFSEPYPGFQRDGMTRRWYIPGREIVHVLATQGDWAQVTVHGDVAGWVDGRQLLPPVSRSIARSEPEIPVPARRSPARQTVPVDNLVGALAGIGVLVGALIDWTRIVRVNSFRIPATFLFDPKTTSRDPRLGYVVLAIGLLGVGVSFLPRARGWRVVLGLLALLVAALYCAQVASQLSDLGGRVSFTDVVGAGPWVTGIAGFVLAVSPLLGSTV
jgi:hypothetical protein